MANPRLGIECLTLTHPPFHGLERRASVVSHCSHLGIREITGLSFSMSICILNEEH